MEGVVVAEVGSIGISMLALTFAETVPTATAVGGPFGTVIGVVVFAGITCNTIFRSYRNYTEAIEKSFQDIILIMESDDYKVPDGMPAGLRDYFNNNKAMIMAKLKMKVKNPREPTPFTHPFFFDSSYLNQTKIWIKKSGHRGAGEIWVFDKLHWSHFEVYSKKKHFDKGNRNRAVWLEGSLKQYF